MDLLLTGDLSVLTQEICRQLGNEHKLVLASKKMTDESSDKRTIVFSFSPIDPMFEKLFASYSFHAAIYVAARGEQSLRQADMIEELNQFLQLCTKHKVSQAIFISSSEVYAGNSHIDESTLPVPEDSFGHILASAENLCRYYREKLGLNAIILHVPYVYGKSVPDSLLARLSAKALHKEKIVLPGKINQRCDFIKDTDLVALIGKLIDEGYELPLGIINVGSENPITLGQLAQLLKKEDPKLDIAFSAVSGIIPPPLTVETARKYYDWIAKSVITEQLPAAMKYYAENAQAKKSFRQFLSDMAVKYKVLLKVLELALGFLLMQYLNNLTQAAVQFSFIDFRLLYVVVIGSIHGIRFGIAAAGLACLSFMLSYSGAGLDWRLLVYNIDNWLPFAAYLVAGTVTGYTKEKSSSTHDFTVKQLQALEERYIFLYKLYDQTIQNKRVYENQLISYRDSFGRIYSVTQRLDSVIPDTIYHEAVSILEDILENQTIAIYMVNDDMSYARLTVSSKGLADKIGSSIGLSEYDVMMKELKCDDIWCNKELRAGYPSYCAPIYNQNQLIAMVLVWEAHYEQIATHYSNTMKVLCGLVQASLVRAEKYNAAIENKIYIKGTRIMSMDKFEEILAMKQMMKQDSVADFVLLHVSHQYTDMRQLHSIISHRIRSTDIIGLGRDGRISIILVQARQGSIEQVVKRLERLGVHCSLFEQPVLNNPQIAVNYASD